MSGTDQTPAVSRPSNQTNSVEPSTADFPTDDIEEQIHERVTEFITEYPHLAEQPISETHGRSLRRIVTEAEYEDVYVETDLETENDFMVSELQRREASTWADAVSAFLCAHAEYHGLMARFANQYGESFEIPLMDAWGETYSKKEYAKAMALEREMSGGERPTGGSSAGEWSDPSTAMLTFTASSTPSERLSPIDHLDAVHDAFSKDGVRDALRNTMEYHLGLESNDWIYWSQAEPHGMGVAADPDKSPGANACYTHLHVGVYFDQGALDPSISLEDVGSELERVITKHIEVCEPASFDAHDYTQIDSYVEDSNGCISINGDIENMGSYMAAYMGGYTEDLLEKPVEYLAWGALYWSGSRRRVSRSDLANEAISADACDQRYESDQSDQDIPHGRAVKWNDGRGADVICACCDSSWRVDQDRLDEPPELDDDLDDKITEDLEQSYFDTPMAELWPSASAGASYGETLTRSQLREKILSFLGDSPRSDWSVPELMGQLSISPSNRSFVEDVLESKVAFPDTDSFKDPPPVTEQWELDAIIDRDGEEHKPSGSGGVDMVKLHLPIQHLVETTRLSIPLQRAETYRCRICNFGTSDAETQAHHLYHEHGLEQSEPADRALLYDHAHNRYGEKHPETKYPY